MPYTTAETLIEKSKSVDAVAPAAFIFHISRCGSTLLTQMLCLDERFIVLSEVPLLDAVLRLPFSHPDKKFPVDELFCALLRILGEKRNENEKFLFIKTDSWHLFFFETIRKLFPTIPALLLYRSPKEVIRSQNKQKGMHAVQGLIEPELFGLTKEQLADFSPDAYLEMILQIYFQKCLEILDKNKKVSAISYHDGPIKMVESTLQSCAISISPDVFAMMKMRTQKHSKNPSEIFKSEEIIPESLPISLAEELFLRIRKT